MFKNMGVSTLAFAAAVAVGLAAAPRLSAQSVPQRLICKDGTVTSTARGAMACFGHGGIDQQASERSQRGPTGVYPNGGTAGTRGVYGSSTGGSTRGVYRGGVAGSDRGVFDRGDRRDRDDDHRWDRERDRKHERKMIEKAERRERKEARKDARKDAHRDQGNHNSAPGRYDNRR